MCVLALLAASTPATGWSQGRAEVIGPGREAEILGLMAPLKPSQEVSPGWRLGDVRIEPRGIVIQLRSEAQSAELRLSHPDDVSSPERTPSFVVQRDESLRSGAGAAAADGIVERVRANDAGRFWGAPAAPRLEPLRALTPHSRDAVWLPVAVTLVGAAAAWLVRGRR